MWHLPLQGKSQQGQIDACHQPRLLPQLDPRNRILSVHLPSQYQRPVEDSLDESRDGASSAVLLPETSLLTVLMYRVGALPVPLLRCSVAAFLVPRGRGQGQRASPSSARARRPQGFGRRTGSRGSAPALESLPIASLRRLPSSGGLQRASLLLPWSLIYLFCPL